MIWALLALGLSAVLPVNPLARQSCEQPSETIYIVNHGYHIGIVLPVRPDSLYRAWEQQFRLGEATYFEFAWGDSAYYMAPDPGLKQAAPALLLPTASVMHVVALQEEPAAAFASSDVREIAICPEERQQLEVFLAKSFLLKEPGEVVYLGPGLYGRSGFYRSNRSYHLLYTCNSWAAKGLRKAHLRTPVWSSFSWPVMWQLPRRQK